MALRINRMTAQVQPRTSSNDQSSDQSPARCGQGNFSEQDQRIIEEAVARVFAILERQRDR